ncbi:MAG TPA: hypothetical protein VJ831_06065, partial [Jatrophihabitantaceae bacterium]|nr:hypothetical protein [Jatrophihabitantaceae bacterium]
SSGQLVAATPAAVAPPAEEESSRRRINNPKAADTATRSRSGQLPDTDTVTALRPPWPIVAVPLDRQLAVSE